MNRVQPLRKAVEELLDEVEGVVALLVVPYNLLTNPLNRVGLALSI